VGVTFRDRNLPTAELLDCLRVLIVDKVVSRKRLRWYIKVDWVSACRELQIEGGKSKGRGRKT